MNQLILLIAAAFMVICGIYAGQQGLALRKINVMLAKIVKDMQQGLALEIASRDPVPIIRGPEWLPIETAPKGETALFLVRAKTPEESYVNSSGQPVVSHVKPHIHIGWYESWSSLCTATGWMPFPEMPK